MNWFIAVLKNYAVFDGRARRKEYWNFILFYVLIFIALSVIDGITGTFNVKSGFGLLTALFMLATLVPSFAVGARRLHDINRSGWWQLIGFIPFIGVLILIILFAKDGQPDENQYGPSPKAALT